MIVRLSSSLTRLLAASVVFLMLGACGIKGPLTQAPAPEPEDPALTAPPRVESDGSVEGSEQRDSDQNDRNYSPAADTSGSLQ